MHLEKEDPNPPTKILAEYYKQNNVAVTVSENVSVLVNIFWIINIFFLFNWLLIRLF